MKNLLKAATRKFLAVADLKLGRRSSFQAITREMETTRAELETTRAELETTRAELETTRKLLAPTALSHSHPKQTTPSPKQPPITQIFISDTETPPSGLLQNCIQSVKRCFPDSEHKIYGNQEIEEFIKKHYDGKLLDCYRRLKPYAYKADLARLCILYIRGGWYADISITWTAPLQIPEQITLFAVRDILEGCKSSWGVSNGIIYAKRGHLALLNAIEAIKENINKNYYGETSLCPTGPNVWGKAIAESCDLGETMFADLLPLTPKHPAKNLAFVGEEGNIFAFFKPTGGGDGLSAFGGDKKNYNTFYSQRDIYHQ